MATNQRVSGSFLFPTPASLRDSTKIRQVFSAAEDIKVDSKKDFGMGMRQAEVF